MSVLTDLIPGGQLLDAIGKVIDRVVPDATANAAAKNALAAAQQSGELNLDLANLQIDLADAKSGNPFQSAWRPALAWSCVASFVYHFLLYNFLHLWLVQLKDIESTDFGVMMGVLTVLIGARTYDKSKGTDTP